MKESTAAQIQAIKTVFPNISEKDAEAFVYSKPDDEPYTVSPASQKQAGVPEGSLTRHHWVNSKYYVGTERDYWLYVPTQYNPAQPACLMVFQDGMLYLFDVLQANIALDNLIHHKKMPVTIALFINAGDKGPGMPIYGGTNNRSIEYDTVDDTYVKFLLEEVLPPIQEQYNITTDAKGRAIVGISSGGACAFNAAWQRPGAFGKAVCHCGSFASIRGADKFPELVRKTPAKPIKVFLQSGEKDLNVVFGSWVLKNKEMAAALEYSGYDYTFVFGKGGHSLKHGAAIFPETMQWLWSDYPTNNA